MDPSSLAEHQTLLTKRIDQWMSRASPPSGAILSAKERHALTVELANIEADFCEFELDVREDHCEVGSSSTIMSPAVMHATLLAFKESIAEMKRFMRTHFPSVVDASHEYLSPADAAIATARDVQTKSQDSVQRSKQVVQDIVQVGHATINTLHSDRETIDRSLNTMEDLDSELGLAKRELVGFGRFLAADRCIHAAIIVLIVGLIVLLGVAVWHRSTRNHTPLSAPSS